MSTPLFKHNVQSSTLHCSDVTCASWRIRSPTNRRIVRAYIKKSLRITDPLWFEFTVIGEFPLQRTVMRRSFHVITSSHGTIIFVISGIIAHRTTVSFFKHTTQQSNFHRQGILYSPRCYMSCHKGPSAAIDVSGGQVLIRHVIPFDTTYNATYWKMYHSTLTSYPIPKWRWIVGNGF